MELIKVGLFGLFDLGRWGNFC